jgi:hypothetical protein
MSALVEVLYPLPDVRRTPLSTLRWWESRRLLYNQVVGATGLFTLAVAGLIGPEGGMPIAMMPQVALVYGVMANICYSMGWGIELAARLLWGRQSPRLGPLLFREGLIFSVGLTLLPVLLMTMFRLVMLAEAVVSVVF